jgi:hypothetical protein
MARQTIGEVIYLASNNHPPVAVEGRQVTCKCGWRGDGYLVHVAGLADAEIHAAGYTMANKRGEDVPSNYR